MTTLQPKLSRLTALDAIRERVFAGDYDAALTLANEVSQPSAVILALRFEDRAVRVAKNAVNAFRALQHRREEGWALLTLAEVHLFREQGAANHDALKALDSALEIADELGAVVFARELRLLPRIRIYLSGLETGAKDRRLLV